MTARLYHPVTQCKLTAGLDAQGNVTALHMRISGQSILAGSRRRTCATAATRWSSRA
jgi:hypothetical protein